MVLVNKVTKRFGEDLTGLTFAIWGLAFKPGTDDVREATSLVVVRELVKRGAKIRAYDSQAIEEFKKAIDDKCLESIKFYDNRYETVQGADSLILITEWKEFRTPDWMYLKEKLNQSIIFDGRNIYNKKIRDLGFELYQIGC
jgi:UDPglucose 6-dehydrogenase